MVASARTPSDGEVDTFRRFVAAGADLAASVRHPPLAEFREFLQQAEPLVVGRIQSRLPSINEQVTTISTWLTPHDLLAVSGRSYLEDPYTELMAWALAPETHAASALVRQQSWLQRVGIPHGTDQLSRPAEPRTQVVTDDGRVDLLLSFATFAVVVESKTGSTEGLTPSGRPQTIAYPEAVRRLLAAGPDFPIHVVFLTRDGDEASNRAALRTTWLEFALSQIAALDHRDLTPHTKEAFGMLFTHFLARAAPHGLDLVAALQSCHALLENHGNDMKPATILKNLGVLDLVLVHLCEESSE